MGKPTGELPASSKVRIGVRVRVSVRVRVRAWVRVRVRVRANLELGHERHRRCQMVHAARTQHETIPGPHDVRATLGGVFERENKNREQYKHATRHTDEQSDGVAWLRALLALGALRVVPLRIIGTELAERALVPAVAVTTAVGARLIAAAARREFSLVILVAPVQVL